MTDKNIHLASNKLIAAAFEAAAVGEPGQCVIGVFKGLAITALKFEAVTEREGIVRAICTGPDNSIVGICEAKKFEDIHDYLITRCQLAPARVNYEWSKFITANEAALPYKTRFEEAELFNKASEEASLGTMGQFEANGLMYSIVHNSAFRIVDKDASKDRTNPEFYTVYIQNSSVQDPDECLVDTESFDTTFEAIVFIRNHIEKSLMKEFMPKMF